MSDYGELSHDHRAYKQRKNLERRDKGTKEIEALTGHGFVVEKLTPYHYRIDGALDLFPTNRLFHALRTNTRGSYDTALAIANKVVLGK